MALQIKLSNSKGGHEGLETWFDSQLPLVYTTNPYHPQKHDQCTCWYLNPIDLRKIFKISSCFRLWIWPENILQGYCWKTCYSCKRLRSKRKHTALINPQNDDRTIFASTTQTAKYPSESPLPTVLPKTSISSESLKTTEETRNDIPDASDQMSRCDGLGNSELNVLDMEGCANPIYGTKIS